MKLRDMCRWIWLFMLAIPLIASAVTPETPGVIGLLEIPSLYDEQSQDHTHDIPLLISESLPYLTGAWNGRVYRTAGNAGTVTQIKSREPEAPVAVAGSAMLDKKLWFMVVVLKESPCASAEAPTVLQAGWIPAHSKSGDLNIWFYSRGC